MLLCSSQINSYWCRKALGARLNRKVWTTICCTSNGARVKGSFTEEEYLLQKQSASRSEWAASVREVTGSRKHQFWEPKLSPPALLEDVVLVIVSPRRPVSLGTVSRAASCFEVSTIRVAQPRCNYVTRHSKSASKGAQYLLLRAETHESVATAIADCDLSVAFTRWVSSGRSVVSVDLPALMNHPHIQALIHKPVPPLEPDLATQGKVSETSQGDESTHSLSPAFSLPDSNQESPSSDNQLRAGIKQMKKTRVALVFGREDLGLSDDEVEACDMACCIPIGRLQESLSLGHAVSIVLSGLYAQRLSFVSSGQQGVGASYVVKSPEGLAEGYVRDVGMEQ